MLILKLIEESDMYGYQMIEELEKRSNHVFTLKAGTLYPILHGLEQQEMITAYDSASEEGRQRRYYRITEKGRKFLGEKKKEWDTFAKAVKSAVLAVLVFGYAGQEFISAIFALGGLILISAAIAKGWFAVEKKKAFALVYITTLLSLLGLFLIKQWLYGDQKNVYLEIIKGKFLIDPDTTDGFFILLVRSMY